MPKQKVHKLTDVDVHTVGLVSMGANQETFFLLKSQEDDMPDEETQVETTEVVGVPQEEQVHAGLLKSIGDMFRSILKEKKEEEVVMETNVVETSEVRETEQEVAKAAEIQAQVVALQKANEALIERLEKAEADAKAERDAREKRDWVEKAGGYAAVPVPVEELAEQLHFLYKADPERAEFWMTTLKAIDNQLREAGLFAEVGTSQSRVQKGTTDALDEVIKTGDVEQIKEAYLQLGKNKGFDYLENRREARRVR